MAEPSLHDPATVSIATALATAGLAWLGQRLVGKAAIQEAINESFHELMGQLRQELREALRERDQARTVVAERDAKIEELRRTIAVLQARIAAPPIRS
jgi:ribosomal protein L29